MTVLEKTAPIGQDWIQYQQHERLNLEIDRLTTAGDFPIALGMLTDRRDRLKVWVQDEILEIQSRVEMGNQQRRSRVTDAPTIAEYERLIAEATADLERLDARIASMNAGEKFDATWDEIPKADNLRYRIQAWERAIVEHPSKRLRLEPMPEFVQI
jgi:hypothetical protein